MMDYSHRQKALAYVLAGIAGYVDAMGFRHLGGVFVSFMSGNTTRLGVDIAMGDWDKAGQVASMKTREFDFHQAFLKLTGTEYE